MSIRLFEKCEIFARLLQGPNSAATTAVEGSKTRIAYFESLRYESYFTEAFQDAKSSAKNLGIPIPCAQSSNKRNQRIPQRLDDNLASAHIFDGDEKEKMDLYSCIDGLINALHER